MALFAHSHGADRAMSIWGGAVEPEIPVRDDERPWAIIASLASMFCAVFGPLIIYFVKKGDSPFAARVAAHVLAFNLGILVFNLLFFLVIFLGMILMVFITASAGPNAPPSPLIAIPIILFVVGYGVMILASLAFLALIIIGTIHAASGKVYRYPFVHRFVD